MNDITQRLNNVNLRQKTKPQRISHVFENVHYGNNKRNRFKKSNNVRLNDEFDIGKFRLKCCMHRPRMHLSFDQKKGDYCSLFYNQLSSTNKQNLNKLLYNLWDIYHPISMDTNCGDRSYDDIHWKLMYDDNAAKYIQILNDEKAKQNKQDCQLIDEYIHHFNETLSDYVKRHEIIASTQKFKDLNIYFNLFQQHKAEWAPKIRNTAGLKLVYADRKTGNVEFMLDDTMETVLYLQHETNDDENNFKMINYENKINTMINTMLCAVTGLKRKINKVLVGSITNNEEWFDLNITVKQSNKNKNCMVIMVYAHVTITLYLYFVFIFKQKWLKQQNNSKLFENWWNLYCQHVVENDKKYVKSPNMKKEFGCNFDKEKDQEWHEQRCWEFNIEKAKHGLKK